MVHHGGMGPLRSVFSFGERTFLLHLLLQAEPGAVGIGVGVRPELIAVVSRRCTEPEAPLHPHFVGFQIPRTPLQVRQKHH